MIHCDFLFYLIKKILLVLLVTKKSFFKKKDRQSERYIYSLKFGIAQYIVLQKIKLSNNFEFVIKIF